MANIFCEKEYVKFPNFQNKLYFHVLLILYSTPF